MNAIRRVSVAIAVGSLLLLQPLFAVASEDENVRKAVKEDKYATLNELGEATSKTVMPSTKDTATSLYAARPMVARNPL